MLDHLPTGQQKEHVSVMEDLDNAIEECLSSYFSSGSDDKDDDDDDSDDDR